MDGTKHPASHRYPPELRERAIRMVFEAYEQSGERHGVVTRIASQTDQEARRQLPSLGVAVPTNAFTLILSGPDPTETHVFASLESGGCNDALFGVLGGVPFADFDRDAPTLGDAVLGAIYDSYGGSRNLTGSDHEM